jgi:hypothetical protein
MNNAATNVTPIESKQPAPAGARFTITASIDGFPVQVEVEGKADVLRAMIDRLKAIGAEPPTPQILQKAQPTKAAGVPRCPVHNSPMKEGRRGYFCPKKVGDSYCKEVA